jgi:hypothetical protein
MQRDINTLRDHKKDLEDIIATKNLLIKLNTDNNEMLKKEMANLI